MDEFEKIKTFSEGLAERQQNVENNKEPSENSDIDFPQYLSSFRAVPSQEEKESKHLLWVVLGLSTLVAVATVAVLVPRFSQMDEEEIVVISPTPVPVKVLPENPGGLSIPDRDKVVYERGDVTDPTPAVESLFPEPEQPVLPVAVIEPELKEETPLIIEEVPVEEPAPVTDVSAPEIPIDDVTTEESVTEDAPVAVVEEVVAQPVEKVQERPEAKKVPEKKPVAKSSVTWRAQLLSSADKKKVETSWKEISKKQAALLSDMPYQIVAATIHGKGTFWRLQVGEFSTKEMAQNLCSKLKKKKQDCLPVK